MKRNLVLIILTVILCIYKSYAQPTIINRGDLAVLGVNAAFNGSRDQISFVCFKDITPGTELQILDVGYGNCINGFWSGGQEGGAKLTRTNTTLPAGTVVTFLTAPFAFANPDNNWTVTDLFVHPTNSNYSVLATDFNINSGGDQLYFAQGGTWNEQASLCTINGNRTSPNAIFPGNNGRILFGFTTNGWQANAGSQSSGESMIFPGMNCFSMNPTNGTSWNKYNGPFTPATQTLWIERISNNSNWQSYNSSNQYNSSGQNFSAGLTLTINAGGGIPTATWAAPVTAICSNTAPINLNSFVTGTSGGTWTGTGVTGNIFNPAGLNGVYDITYTINYVSGGNSCPIAQTSTVNVVNNIAPTVTSLYNYCQNETTPALTATGTNLLWYTVPTDGIGSNTAPIPSTTTVGFTNYYVSQTVNGCESPRSLIRVNINEAPTINAIANQSLCVNTLTSAINFSGNGLATYNWTNSNTAIGLAASGSGNIASFNALNTGSTPITATIIATPTSTGYAYVANYGTLLSPGNTVSVINTSTNAVVRNIIVGSAPFGVAVNADGSRVYVANYRSNSVSVINTFTNVVSNTISVGNLPMALAVSPDGTRVYVTNQLSNTVSVINTATNTVIASIPVSLQPQGITISPDGTRVYVANVNSNNISIINTATNIVLGVIGVGTQPITVAISPDGSRLFVPNFGSNNLSVINTTSNTVIATIATGTNPNGVAVSPDGSKVYVTNQNSANVTVINTTNNTVSNTIAVNNNPQGISFTSDGLKAYVCNFGSNNVSVINTTNNTIIATVTVGSVPHSLGNFISPSNGCIGAPTSFTITVNPLPAATINYSGSPFCAVGTITPTIVGTTGGTFTSTTGLQINSSTGVIDLANSTPGNYTITYSFSTNNCANTTSTSIVIHPSFNSTPTLSITQPTCTISTGIITVTTPLGIGFSYSIDGTNYTNTTGIFTNLAPNTYSVTVKNNNGCVSMAATAIVNTIPNPPNIPTTTVTQPTCNTPLGSLTVTSPLGTGFTYSIDGTNYTNTTGIFNNLNSGNYTVTVKDNNGCISTATTTVINTIPNNPIIPTVSIVQPTCVVPIGNVTVTSPVGAGFTYSIDGTNFQTSTTFNNLSPNNYTITVKNAAGCSNTNTFTIVQSSTGIAPTFIITQPNCATTTVVVTYTSPIGANFNYSIDGTTFQSSPIFNNVSSGSYNFIVRDVNTNCLINAGSRVINVTPNIPPAPTATTSIQYCRNTTAIQLSATGSNLLWYTSLTATVSSTTAPTPNTSNVGVTTYYVSQTVNNCESNRTAITVTVEPSPTTPIITSNGPMVVCNNQSIVLNTTSTFVLQWYKDGVAQTGQNGNSLSVNMSGTYTVQATNYIGCTSTSTGASIINVASPVFNAGTDKLIKPTDSIQLITTVNGGNIFTYVWTPTTYLSNSTIANPWVIKPQTDITYTVTVTNNNGCSATSSVTVKVIKDLVIPNAFSPNGDGLNDTWEISGLNLDPFCVLEIFNRNGQIVYRSTGYTKPWDGSRNGKPLPVGVYYYIISANQNKNKYTGWISLIR